MKLLIYAPEGSIVAAPTTSLPEWTGGDRNWDYRYTWLRDSSFLLYALHVLGYYEEAHGFMDWLTRVHRRDPRDFQILYGIDGSAQVPEAELPDLEGYRESRPVRIGNAAADQLQLDVYGEIIDAAYLHRRYGGGSIDPGPCTVICDMLDFVCGHWREPDNGIWEVRGPRRHFLYSKLLSWVALDRGIRLADELGLRGDLDHWAREREEVRRAIHRLQPATRSLHAGAR